MSPHVVRVASQPGPTDTDWAHLAVCSCEWREVYATRADAEMAAAEHAKASEGKQP